MVLRGLFTAQDLRDLRAFNTETQADECVIRSPGTRGFDSDTLRSSIADGAQIYSGPCQLKESDVASLTVVGEAQLALQHIDVYIDHDAANIPRRSTVEITSSGHAWLVGRELVVLDQRVQTQTRARKLVCEFAESV